MGDRGVHANALTQPRCKVEVAPSADAWDANADGHIGMLCCWMLLNLSSLPRAQVRQDPPSSPLALTALRD